MRAKKNILMISQALFPPDIRLEKEIKSLSEAGYKILVVCNQYDKELNPTFGYCEIKKSKCSIQFSHFESGSLIFQFSLIRDIFLKFIKLF